MGFFDSFKKKAGEQSNKESSEQMPPPPKANIPNVIKPPENSQMPAPPQKKEVPGTPEQQIPPLPQSNQLENPPKMPSQSAPYLKKAIAPAKKTDLPSLPQQNPDPLFQPSPVTSQTAPSSPSLPEEKKRSGVQKDLTNLPARNNIQNLPPRLPELPQKLIKRELPKYNVKEIPSFDIEQEIEMPILEDLPLLDVEEREEIYKNYRHKHINKPLFIRTDEYKEVLETVNNFKNYLSNSLEMLSSLETLKRNTDMEHKTYKESLEDIQRKLIYVDKTLFSS